MHVTISHSDKFDPFNHKVFPSPEKTLNCQQNMGLTKANVNSPDEMSLYHIWCMASVYNVQKRSADFKASSPVLMPIIVCIATGR